MKTPLPGARKVLVKELKEMIRDRRVVIAALVMPIFIIGLFIFLIGSVSKSVQSPQGLTIAQVGPETPLTAALSTNEEIIEVIPQDSLDQAITKLQEGEVRVVLQTPESPDPDTNQQKLTLHYLGDSPRSQIAAGVIREAVSEANKASLKNTLSANNIPQESAEPILVEAVDASEAEGLGGSAIIDLLPYLIVLWAFYGGMSIVSDLVAGEKERGTMETLLISPIRRAEVAIGKIVALAVVCFASASTTLIGIALLGALKLEATKDLFESGMSLSFTSIIALILILSTLVIFFSAMMVAISAFSKNIRESQTYLSLVSFAILLPAIFSQFIGFTDAENQTWVNFAPVLNSSMAIKSALKSELDPTLISGSIGVNIILGVIFLALSISLFRKEAILTRV